MARSGCDFVNYSLSPQGSARNSPPLLKQKRPKRCSLTLADGVTASGESVTIGTDTYYASNTNVTFTYNGSIPRGYVLDIKVKDAGNNDIAVTESNDTYTFKMPASDATVSGITDVWGIASDADGSEALPYIISTTAGLDLLAKMVNGIDGNTADKFDGKFFKLGNDKSKRMKK